MKVNLHHHLPAILIQLFCWSCGYSVGNMQEYKSIKVPIFNNNSDRRMNEFTLTEIVIREIMAQGIAVNREDAEVELIGEITDYNKPGLVEGRDDRIIVGSVAIKVSIILKNRKTGATLLKDSRTESANVVGSRGETEESAKQEIFTRLAQWIATKCERSW